MNENFKKVEDLVEYLNETTRLYDEGNPVISDAEWDEAYFKLVQLEKETGIILNNSPTQVINYEVVNSLKKVEHSHKMLSLDKTKEINDVLNFLGEKENYLIMLKMDGLTCSLTYEDGKLIQAETRGNGLIGEDILHNARVINNIPKQIPYKDKLVIDGEIICKYDDFELISSEYKNSRNFAAGSIRLLDSKECAKRRLTFIAWEVIEGFPKKNSLFDKFIEIHQFGFDVVPYMKVWRDQPTTYNFLEEKIQEFKIYAQELNYPIDGIVFKFDNVFFSKLLGETAHHFKNAIAYKFYDEEYETELIDIEWTMGRTGILTPVAHFHPVEIDGCTVERASLHNISIMEELSGGFERVGDKLFIFKANQIIPQVSSWEHPDNYSEETHLSIPKHCPICGAETTIKMDNNSKMLMCMNPNCEGKLINTLDHFCGKKGLDIKGLSKATLEKLINWGWLDSISGIFELHRFAGGWYDKPGFGKKSVENIISAIEKSKKTSLSAFICALGIPLIGSVAAKRLEKEFKTWDNFISAVENNYKFYNLSDFGIEMDYSLKNYNYSEAKILVEEYITFEEQENNNSNNLDNIVFVITGKLNNFSNRDELKNLIESKGGKVTGSVSKKTSYLINNDSNSSSAKNKTAQSLNIPILTEADFIEKFC